MKICTKCGIEKPRSEYSNDKSKCDGLRPSCKECSHKYLQAHRSTPEGKAAHLNASNEYFAKNKERILAKGKAFRAEHPDEERAIRSRYAERRKKNARDWVVRNKEHINAYREATKVLTAARARKYRRADPGKFKAIKARYRAAKVQATPNWANPDAIRAYYTLASAIPGTHVDHIVPLVSKLVCGLHCETNLQLLPGPENQRKGNRKWPDMP